MGVETLLKGSSSSKLASQLKTIAKTDGVDVGTKAETFGRALESARRIVDGAAGPKSKKSKDKSSNLAEKNQAEVTGEKGQKTEATVLKSKASKTSKTQTETVVKGGVTKADVEKAEGQAVAAKPTRAHIVAESVKATLERLAAEKTTGSKEKTKSVDKKSQKSTSEVKTADGNAETTSGAAQITTKEPKASVEVATLRVDDSKTDTGRVADAAPVQGQVKATKVVREAGSVDANKKESVAKVDGGLAVSDENMSEAPVASEQPSVSVVAGAPKPSKETGPSVGNESGSKIESVNVAEEVDARVTPEKTAAPEVKDTTADVKVMVAEGKEATRKEPLSPKTAVIQDQPASSFQDDVSGAVAASVVAPERAKPLAEPAVPMATKSETVKQSDAAAGDLAGLKVALKDAPKAENVSEAKAAASKVSHANQKTNLQQEAKEKTSESRPVDGAKLSAAPMKSDEHISAGNRTSGLKSRDMSPAESSEQATAVQAKMQVKGAQKSAVLTAGIESKDEAVKEPKVALPTGHEKTEGAELQASQHLARAVGRQSIAKVVTDARGANKESRTKSQPALAVPKAETAKVSQKPAVGKGEVQVPSSDRAVAEPLRTSAPLPEGKGKSDAPLVMGSSSETVRPEPKNIKTKSVVAESLKTKTVESSTRTKLENSVEPVAVKGDASESKTAEKPVSNDGLRVRLGNSKDQLTFSRSSLADTIASRRESSKKGMGYARPAAGRNRGVEVANEAKLGSMMDKTKPETAANISKNSQPERAAQEPAKVTELATDAGKTVKVQSAVASTKPSTAIDQSKASADVAEPETNEQQDSRKMESEKGRQGGSQSDTRRENESRHQEVKQQILREMQATDEAADELEEALDVEMADEVVQAKQTTNSVKATARETGRTAITAMRDATETSRNQDVVSERRELHERILAKNLGRNLGRIASMGTTHAKLQLHPQELGRVDVEIRTKDGEVTLLVRTETVQAAAELNSQMNDLRGSMREHGLELKDCDVDARGFGNESNEAGSDRDGSGSSGRGEENRENRGNRRRRGRAQRIKRSAIDVVV